jgi:hypothetical protein
MLLLTKESDRLPALSAIADGISGAIKDTYLAGVRQSDIIQQLGWVSTTIPGLSGSSTLRTISGKLPRVYRAPSWSWASIDGPVSYPRIFPSAIPRVQVLQVDCTPVSHSPTGEVKDGLLQLSASIVTCRLRFEIKGPNVLGYMESNPVSESSHIFEDDFWSDVPLDEETNATIPAKYHFSDRTLVRSHVIRPNKPPADVLSKHGEVKLLLLVGEYDTEALYLVLAYSVARPGTYERIGILCARHDELADKLGTFETQVVTIV